MFYIRLKAHSMSSYIQLATQIEKLKKEAEAARKREMAETIANIKRAIELFGLTAEDLGLGRSGKKRGRKASAKSAAKSTGAAKRRGRPPKAAASSKAGRKAGRKASKKRGRKAAGVDKRSVVAPNTATPVPAPHGQAAASSPSGFQLRFNPAKS